MHRTLPAKVSLLIFYPSGSFIRVTDQREQIDHDVDENFQHFSDANASNARSSKGIARTFVKDGIFRKYSTPYKLSIVRNTCVPL